MRQHFETVAVITEGIVYLAVSPFIFIACKTMEIAGLIDKDENDG